MGAALGGNGGNGEVFPLRPGERLRDIEDRDGARFVPVALFLIDRAGAGKGSLRRASPFNRLPQVRLVVLELSDKMDARILGVLESFFDSEEHPK